MKFKVAQNKLRLDRFLSASMQGVSRNKLQQDIKAGSVSVNGRQVFEAGHVVRLGDNVEYKFVSREKISPKPMDIKILYENKDILIIDKPAGLVIHPAPGYKGATLAEGLLYKYKKDIADVGEDEIRPGIVHRLDKDTSGVMLVAKTPAAYSHLKDAFAGRKIKKEYLALVCGKLEQKHGFINSPIGRNAKDFRKMTAVLPKEPKEAMTEFFVLKHFSVPSAPGKVDEFTLVRVKLHTGRTHQIRVHFSSLGFPVAGDTLYGKCSALGLSRQFLHAAKLEVRLPDNTWIEAESLLPEDLSQALGDLEKLSK